jgi:glutathione synthase/RimK-type ligase-like ATP-grasp enzyme
MSEIKVCSALLWHWQHSDHAASLVASSVIKSAEQMGLVVYPSTNTSWHYDDKIAQKYLLESIGVPIIPTHVFFEKASAIEWINGCQFPIVHKLRKGAGSANVRLVKNQMEARNLIDIAFGKGFVPSPSYFGDFARKVTHIHDASDLIGKITGFPQSFARSRRYRRSFPREKGYFLVQNFIPNNTFDTRIALIGERAVGARRFNRPGDFRASGSGSEDKDPSKIDLRMVAIAFRTAREIGAQSMAFDFLVNTNGDPVICEMSYTFPASSYASCQGQWDRELNWHEELVPPEMAILDDVLSEVSRQQSK